jgi:hippurate hydrolase
VLEAIERIVRAECVASRSPREPDFVLYDRHPLTDNDAGVTARVATAFATHFGDRAVTSRSSRRARTSATSRQR